MYITPIHVQDILKSLYFLSFSFFLSLLFRRNHWIAMQKQLLYRDTFMKFKMKHVFNLWCSKYEYETGGTNLRINRDSNPGPLTFQNLSCIVKYVQIYVFKYFYHEQFVNCLPCLMKCRCNAGLLHGTYCLLFMITKNLFLIQYWVELDVVKFI